MQILFTQLLNMIYDGISNWLLDIAKNSILIFNNDTVNKLLDFFQDMGWIIYAVGVLFAIANFCINKSEGGNIPFEDLFKGIMFGMVACYFMRPGAIFIYTMADSISSAIRTAANFSNADSINIMVKALNSSVTKYAVLFSIVLTIIYIILLSLIFIQALKRSGLYVMQILVGYLYIFGLPAGNYEGIFDWCRQTTALAATNILQMAGLLLSLNLIISGDFMASLGMLFAACSAEKVAGRFGMSPGARDTVGTAVRSISSITQIVKTVGMARGAA